MPEFLNDPRIVERVPLELLLSIFGASSTRALGTVEGFKAYAGATAAKFAPFLGRRNPELGSIYCSAYQRLKNIQPAEYVFKNALVQRQVFGGRGGCEQKKIYFEFRAGASKLDALVVDDSISAFEIKTDRDDFARLPSQLQDYQSRFSLVWVVAGQRHCDRLQRSVGPGVGIAVLKDGRRIEILREALPSECLSSESMIGCLRKDEYLRVLAGFGLDARGIPNTRVFGAALELARSIEPSILQDALRVELRSRKVMLSKNALKMVPLALRAAALTHDWDLNEVRSVLENLKSKIFERRKM